MPIAGSLRMTAQGRSVGGCRKLLVDSKEVGWNRRKLIVDNEVDENEVKQPTFGCYIAKVEEQE